MKVKLLILPILLLTLYIGNCKITADADDTSEIKLATWNIRILSDGSRDDSILTQIAEVIKRYDLIAIQEARDSTVLNRLKNILSGYDYIASTPVGTSVKEIYVYFYKSPLISVIGTPYIYVESADEFIREPYVACFKSGNFDFTLITIHVLYGYTVAERREEIKLLDDVLLEVENANGGEKDIILLGDFNFPSDDVGWQISSHQAVLDPAIKTTITDTSSYDNIWINLNTTTEYREFHEVYKFDEITFNKDDDAASLAVSDHRPVSIILSTNLPDDDTGPGCGTTNSPITQGPPDVRIYSVTASPTDSEQVTLKNYSSFTADISNWIIGDKNNPDVYKVPNNTFVDPGVTKTFPKSTLGFGINDSGEIIYLKNASGTIIETWSN